MSLLVDLNTEPPKLAITLIPLAIPLPLRIIGTGQFDWNLAYRNDLLGLQTAIGQVSIAHNNLYHYAIDEFGAIVLQVDQMKLETANTKSLIEQETLQRVEQNFALTQQINILSASTLETSAQIQEEQLVRANAVSALATQLQQQVVRIDDTYAKIAEESTTRVALNNTLAQEIELTKTSLQGHIAEVEVSTQSSIDTINGQLQAINASYGVKLTVDGLVGGFFVNNNGEFVEASFDVDNFSIGRGTIPTTKPFALVDDVLYLNNTRITFDWLRSTSGDVVVSQDAIQARYLNVKGLNVNNTSGTSTFSIDTAGNAFFAGALQGATGTFNGRLAAGTLDMSAFGGITQTYSIPGWYTITVPTGLVWSRISMRVVLQGGGGGGGGGTYDYSGSYYFSGSGGGGGAGTRTQITLDNVTPGTTYSLYIGNGGAAGVTGYALSNTAGGNGEATVLSGVLSASAGTGGAKGTDAATNAGGSIGGGNGTGYGGGSSDPNLRAHTGGVGGSSPFSAGGTGGSGYANGADGSLGSGGGGGGATAPWRGSASSGGKGGNGHAIIEFFDPNTVVLNTRYTALIGWLDTLGYGAVPTNAR